MWSIFTYIYNSLLVIFIAAHLLVGAGLCFGVGIYTGIYLSQNYHVPRVDEPYKLWEKFLGFMEQYRMKAKEKVPQNPTVDEEYEERSYDESKAD